MSQPRVLGNEDAVWLDRVLMAYAGDSEVYNLTLRVIHTYCVFDSSNIPVVANSGLYDSLRVLRRVVSQPHPNSNVFLDVLSSVRGQLDDIVPSPPKEESFQCVCSLAGVKGSLTVHRTGLRFGENLFVPRDTVVSCQTGSVLYVWHTITVSTQKASYVFTFGMGGQSVRDRVAEELSCLMTRVDK